MANYRSRITGLRRVKASDLTPHPENWREHPPEQIGALEGVLGDVGFAGAVLARELPDGRLQIIDGHARAETMGDQEVPVLVTDLDEDEARLVLATYDPIGAMAESNGEALTALLDELPPVDDEALDDLLEADSNAEPTEGAGEVLSALLELLVNIDDPSMERPTARDWFGGQSTGTQREMLGAAKFDAWKSGGIDFGDMVQHTTHPDWGRSATVATLGQMGLKR